MSLIDPNDGQPFFCFDHGKGYGDDGLYCHMCMADQCSEADSYIQKQEKEMTVPFYKKPKTDPNFVAKDMAELQEESLVNFGAAIGYEPVYDLRGLRGFRQPNFSPIGRERVSVNTMIRLHNESAEETFAMLKMTPYIEFGDYLKDQKNIDDLITIFAGTTKIVERVKAVFSKKQGLVIQDNNVKFMTKRDQRYYGF